MVTADYRNSNRLDVLHVPTAWSCSFGPMPDNMRICGDWIVPALTITSFLTPIVLYFPSLIYSTPVTFFVLLSIRIFVTWKEAYHVLILRTKNTYVRFLKQWVSYFDLLACDNLTVCPQTVCNHPDNYIRRPEHNMCMEESRILRYSLPCRLVISRET
jgi:hypothetical protein